MEKGSQGLEFVMIRYGKKEESTYLWRRWKDERESVRRRVALVQDMSELLSMDRGVARVLIVEELRRTDFQSEEISTMMDLTEEVSQGEISWADYCPLMTHQLVQLKTILEKDLKLGADPDWSEFLKDRGFDLAKDPYYGPMS